MPQLLDQCNRRLIALVTQRKSIAQSSQTAKVSLYIIRLSYVLLIHFLGNF